jgi:SNF2 family DNA or RNA helicase
MEERKYYINRKGKKVKPLPGVSHEYQKATFKRRLSKEFMINSNFNDIVRAAAHNKYAARRLYKYFKLRGLPLRPDYSLYPYQVKTLTWLRQREKPLHGMRGGIVCLQMGMGKTLCSYSHILTSPRPPCPEKHGENGFPSLVLCSKTNMMTWRDEAYKFFGDSIKVLFFHKDYIGEPAMKSITRQEVIKYDLVVTTYDVARIACTRGEYVEDVLVYGERLMTNKVVEITTRSRSDADRPKVVGEEIIYGTPWEMVISDESQIFCNPKTKTYRYIMAIYGRFKVCLSGTPIRNYCLTGNTRVITNKGNIPIRNLVRTAQPKSLRALSYNINTDTFEYKRIENGWELKTDRLVRIHLRGCNIICTPDHPILTASQYSVYQLKYTEARDIRKNDLIVHYHQGISGTAVKDRTYILHQVSTVEYINDPADNIVYDIQVADNHNFVIGGIHDNIKYGPVVSNCTDAWSQFRFLGYNSVTSALEWKRRWKHLYNQQNLPSVILKMTYEDAGIKLPDKVHKVIEVTLTGRGKEAYDLVQKVAVKMYGELERDLVDFMSILAMFTRLRQVCIAPYLITKESKRKKKMTTKEEINYQKELERLCEIYKGSLGAWIHNKKGSAGIRSKKMKEIIKTLKLLKSEKMLIFSSFTSAIDLLSDACDEFIPDLEYVKVDGDVTGIERIQKMDEFKFGKPQVLMMTYKVGSEGLNLPQATQVVCLEPWWNSAVINQAVARCWRIGQTQTVNVHDIYISNSIEDRMLEICHNKNEMTKMMLEGGTYKMPKLDKYTVGKILGIYPK